MHLLRVPIVIRRRDLNDSINKCIVVVVVLLLYHFLALQRVILVYQIQSFRVKLQVVRVSSDPVVEDEEKRLEKRGQMCVIDLNFFGLIEILLFAWL